MTSPKLLIDFDYFLYRVTAALEREHHYSPELTVIVGNFQEGKRLVQNEINKLLRVYDSEKFILCFTDTVYYRKEIDPTYKGNRTKRKPCGYLRLKEWCLENLNSRLFPTLEADDVLGILATCGKYNNSVVVSPDKDLLQIPGRIYNLKTEVRQTPENAERQLWLQTLSGDATDGYSGCFGIGLKSAKRILKRNGNYPQKVLKTFLAQNMSEEDAVRSYHLAKILHHKDWNEREQKPKLFNPYENKCVTFTG